MKAKLFPLSTHQTGKNSKGPNITKWKCSQNRATLPEIALLPHERKRNKINSHC